MSSKKYCPACKKEKSFDSFYKSKSYRSGHYYKCKKCSIEYARERRRRIREELKHSDFPEYKTCFRCNRKKSCLDFNLDTSSKDGRQSYCKSCKNKYITERRKNDEVFYFYDRMRITIAKAIRGRGYDKDSSTEEILGISFEGFKSYIENKFKDGMGWDNRSEWHIDHIIPISSANNKEEAIRLSHYTNLQPLWAEENLRKSNKLNYKG